MQNSQKNLDQQRAAHAWECLSQLVENNLATDQYIRAAKKMPVRIVASGLGQALAFVYAKKIKMQGQDLLLKHIKEWLGKRGLAQRETKSLIDDVLKYNTDELRCASAELLAWLQWLNRFAEGRFPKAADAKKNEGL